MRKPELAGRIVKISQIWYIKVSTLDLTQFQRKLLRAVPTWLWETPSSILELRVEITHWVKTGSRKTIRQMQLGIPVKALYMRAIILGSLTKPPWIENQRMACNDSHSINKHHLTTKVRRGREYSGRASCGLKDSIQDRHSSSLHNTSTVSCIYRTSRTGVNICMFWYEVKVLQQCYTRFYIWQSCKQDGLSMMCRLFAEGEVPKTSPMVQFNPLLLGRPY